MPKLLLIALLMLCARKGFGRDGSNRTTIPDMRSAQDTTTAPDTTLPLRTTVVLPPTRPAIHLPTSAGKSPVSPPLPPKAGLITKPAVTTKSAITTTPAIIRIYNPSAAASLANIALDWELQADGEIRQKGRIGNITIGSRQEKLVHLSLRIPNGEEEEIFLQVRYRLQPVGTSKPVGTPKPIGTPQPVGTPKPVGPPQPVGTPHSSASPGAPIPDGPILAQYQILLRAAAGNNLIVAPAGELSFADENDTFSIRSSTIHLAFNKQTGWLQHYEINGIDLLEDTSGLKSSFWLPVQERGSLASGRRPMAVGGDSSSRPFDSAKAWLEATRDPHLQLFSTSTGSELVIVRTEYTLPATSCLLHLSYTINAAGEMLVSQQLEPDTAQTGLQLPCFGMKWTLPAGYDSVTYYGKNPDTSSWIAIYRKKLNQTPAPDIHPRGTAAGSAIRWWKITGQDGRGLLITADSSFLDVSALPPPMTELSIDYPHFDLPYANYRYAFKVSPVIAGHP
jgi:beta-galactosidase